MRVKQTCRHGCAGVQPQISGGLRRQAMAQPCAGFHDLGADAGEAFVSQNAKTCGLEIAWVPPAFVGKVGPFASQCAG